MTLFFKNTVGRLELEGSYNLAMSRQIFEARPTSLLNLDRKAFSKDLLLFLLLLALGKQVTKRGFVERSPKSLQIRPLLLTVLLKTRLIQSVYSETPI